MAVSMSRRCGGCCWRCAGCDDRPGAGNAGFSRLSADPFSGQVFIFRGKRGHYLKGLYWDGSGLCLFAKRLERGKFVWPPLVDGTMTLTPAQLALLIEAMDWRRTIAPPAPPRPMLL